jgi:hypothetical protein
MSYLPKHSAARKHGKVRKPGPLRARIAGVALAGSATFITGIGVSPPAQAEGSVWDRVAACESSGEWDINTGNSFYGGLQFTKTTWLEFGGGRYASHAHRANRATQIGIARRVLGTQGPEAWPVCAERAGLTNATGDGVKFAFTPTVRPKATAPRSKATASPPKATASRSKARVAISARGRLDVDGQLGPKTAMAIQRWVGTTKSGVFGPRTVKVLQRKLGSTADGLIGPRTVRALQRKIGARRDGAQRLNAATVASFQRYLNRR